MLNRIKKYWKLLLSLFFVSLYGFSIAQANIKIQTIIRGYELGKLKGEESELLYQRGLLRVELAKITNKKELEILSKVSELKSKKNLAYITQ